MTPKKTVTLLLTVVGLGVGVWALVLPALSNKTANDKLTDIAPQTAVNQPAEPGQMPAAPGAAPAPPAGPQAISKGSFSGLNRQSGSGSVTLLKQGDTYFVRLEDDFKVSNGPDLFVSFGNGGKADTGSGIVERLKANAGGQNYQVPASIDPTKYSQVFIHCKAFAYSFAVADLK